MKRKIFGLIGTMFFITAFFAFLPYGASGTTFDELVKMYNRPDVEGQNLKDVGIEHIIEESDVEVLWDSAVTEKDPTRRAAIAERIIEITAKGDLSGWHNAEGFTGSTGYSRSVVTLSAGLMYISSLLETDVDDHAWLAHGKALEFFESPYSFRTLYRISGKDAKDLTVDLKRNGGYDWVKERGFGSWDLEKESILPFGIAPVKKVRGYSSASRAIPGGILFLDGYGVPTTGIGEYSWNWRTGSVSRVRSDNDK